MRHLNREKNLKESGFTLVELLVVLSITGIITVGAVNFMVSQSRSYNLQEDIHEMEQNARVAMDHLTKDLQKAVSVTLDPDGTNADIKSADIISIQINGDDITYEFIQGDDLYSNSEFDAGRITVKVNGDDKNFIASFITQDLTPDVDADPPMITPDTPMFQVDDPVNPRVVTVTIIARTRRPDPNYTALNNGGYRQIVLTRRVVLMNG